MADSGVAALAAALAAAPPGERLRVLSLGHNRISAAGGSSLAALVGLLESLDVSGNPFGADGARPLLAAYQAAAEVSATPAPLPPSTQPPYIYTPSVHTLHPRALNYAPFSAAPRACTLHSHVLSFNRPAAPAPVCTRRVRLGRPSAHTLY